MYIKECPVMHEHMLHCTTICYILDVTENIWGEIRCNTSEYETTAINLKFD